MPEDRPVMTALAEITAVSLLHSNLPAREHMIARLAALVAVDAPTASYVMNASTVAQTGITVEDVQSLLVAVAPWWERHGSSPRPSGSPRLSVLSSSSPSPSSPPNSTPRTQLQRRPTSTDQQPAGHDGVR